MIKFQYAEGLEQKYHLESNVEKYLTDRVKKLGGWSRKWASPNHRGVPDRIVFFGDGQVFFVELKTSKGKPSVLQAKEIELLRNNGHNATIVYGRRGVDLFLEDIADAVGRSWDAR